MPPRHTDRLNACNVPPEIVHALSIKLATVPKKNQSYIDALSELTRIPTSTLYKIFSRSKHVHLEKFKRVSEMLEWRLKDFSKMCLTNSPLELKTLVYARLQELQISTHRFHKTTNGVAYYQQKRSFRALRTYTNIAFYLGITLDDLAKILLTKKAVDKNCKIDNMVA
jgi:hypothetical protein